MSDTSILVDIPHSTRNGPYAFIVAPFCTEFHEFIDSVQAACTKAGVTPVDTRNTARNTNYPKEIRNSIRGANLVVAFCTPDPSHHQVNPNVMYEIGLADSLGKPLILVIDSTSNLPSNLETHKVHEYGEFQKRAFIDALTSEILLIRQRTNDGPVDPECEGVCSMSRAVICWWREAAPIIEAAKIAHNKYQAIQIGHLNTISYQLDELMSLRYSPSEPKDYLSRRRRFEECWEVFASYWQREIGTGGGRITERLSAAQGALTRLRVATPAQSREDVDRCESFFKRLSEACDVAPRQYDEVKRQIDDAVKARSSGIDQGRLANLHGELKVLNWTVNQIVTSADGLLLNVLPLLPINEETK